MQDPSVILMEVVPGDDYKPEIWEDYKAILGLREPFSIGYLERFDFYERRKRPMLW